MLKRLILFFIIALAVIALASCPAVLSPNLPSDFVISLGVVRPAEGNTSIGSAVGGEIHVPVTIIDSNNLAAAGSYEVDFTLSTDNDLATTGDNIAVGTETITAGTDVVVTLTVPAAAAAGTYNLFASFEAAAGEPAVKVGGTRLNLSYVQVVIGATNEADLELEFVNPPLEFRAPGSTFPLSFKVSNTGNKKLTSATAIVVRFQIPISGTPTKFGETTVTLAEDLLPNDFVTGTATITMPSLAQIAADLTVAEADVEDWFDTLTGTVDPDDSIVEIVEGGTDTFIVESGTTKPELTVSAVDSPDYAVVEGPVEVAVKVSNGGYAPAAAGSYSLILFYDADGSGTRNTGDVDIHTWAAADTPAVPQGQEVLFYSTAVENLTYPATVTAGTNDIGAVITGDLDEWDTTNNTTTAQTEFIASDVDLAFDYISSSLSSVIDDAVGGTVPVSLMIKNSGSESVTTDFSVTFYASANSGLTPGGDIDLGSKTVTADIAPGKKISVTYDAAFPSGQGAGFYTIYAVIDSADAVAEFDESNNSPAEAAESPVFVVVDDGTSALSANILLGLPYGVEADYSYYQYINFYDSVDPWVSPSNHGGNVDNESGPKVLLVWWINLTAGQKHGARFYATTWYNLDYHAYCWRIVPDYVNDIADKYIPTVLPGRDQYEENDTEGDASELTGSAHPFHSWVSSYDTDSTDEDYYTFYF